MLTNFTLGPAGWVVLTGGWVAATTFASFVDEINNAGGAPGRQTKLVIENDQRSTPGLTSGSHV